MGELRNGSQMRNCLVATPNRRDSQFDSNSHSNWRRLRHIVAVAPLEAAAFFRIDMRRAIFRGSAIISDSVNLIYI